MRLRCATVQRMKVFDLHRLEVLTGLEFAGI
jgi:hypothetical protein